MKKFFYSLVVIMLSAVTVLSGCSLIQTDTEAYYNRVVASVGDITVTKRELMTYYTSVLQQGASYSVEEVLEEVINRKLIVEEVKNNLAKYVEALGETLESGEVDKEYPLKSIVNKYYHNDVMQQVYDYVDSQILIYENIIRSARGMELVNDDTATTPSTTYSSEVKFEKEYEKVGDKYYVVKEIEQETDYIANYSYNHINHGSESIRTEAYEFFIKYLIRTEQGKNLSTDPTEVLNRDIDRVYKIYADNKLNSLFQNAFEYQEIDSSLVVKKYKELVKSSYSEYLLEGENGLSTYLKNIKPSTQTEINNRDTIIYHPYENTDKNYIQVAHILVKFTDEQLTGELFDNEESELYGIGSYKEIVESYANNDISEEQYTTRLNLWKEKCSGKARYTLDDQDEENGKYAGNEYGEDISYTEIFAEIKLALEQIDASGISADEKVVKKAEAINSYIYKFSQDTGSLNSAYYYSIALDGSDIDSWAPDFAQTALDVYNQKGAGAYSEPFFTTTVTETVTDGKKTYSYENAYAGYHMVFVVGEYKNLCSIENIDNLGADFVETLYNARLMLGTEKTVFDYLCSLITFNDYNSYRQDFVENLRKDLTIVYDRGAYKDLL